MRGALLAAALVACGDTSVMPDVDAGSTSDGGSCAQPALDAAWLREYVSDIISGLPSPRATTTQRTAARTYLQTVIGSMGWTAQVQAYSTGANVYARIPATTGSETRELVVGAHFDTVPNSPGANDNASGVAASLAIARFLRDMPCRRYPVTLVLFDEEEVGLVGARVHASALTAAGVHSVHTIDQIGWDQDGDRRFELESPTADLEATYRAAAMVVGVPVVRVSTEGTDHEAYRDRGLASIGLTEEYVGGDTTPHRHTAQDTVATIDLDYLVLGTQLVAQAVMTELAP